MAVDRRTGDAAAIEKAGDLLCTMLGAGED
jgi:hypothetical protein